VQGKIADLRQMEGVLKETVARCEAGSGSHCPMIDALYTDSESGRRAAKVKRSQHTARSNGFVPEGAALRRAHRNTHPPSSSRV
jgi:hypothetical protein